MSIDEAKRLAKNGQREEAAKMLSRMMECGEGKREDVLLELGAVYYAKGDTTSALNCLNEVVRLNPANRKAKAYLEMINGILDYYCKDLLNP
ncbi:MULTISPECIES: tetratricopeptide repeat protein [Butyricimonas]|uniref:tetratricopeptide repeat protein n=1 Tax=Butyricimonas TaxID=574697 RepID=UPI0007FB4D3D|nr:MULTISPECIES: tetratricopeptide repeat protein [Butyricimonas]